MSAERPRRVPLLVTLAISCTVVGLVVCLLLLVRETPYTLTAFMFVGQPLLVAGFALYAWKVIRDLKRKEVL